MKHIKSPIQKLQFVIASALLVGVNLLAGPLLVHAAPMTHATVMEYNMNAAGSGQVAFAFTAGSSVGAGSLTLNFGSWGGTVNATQTVATAGCQALTGATNTLPGSITAAGAGQVVTVSSVGALTAGQSYCAILTSTTAVTNPGIGVYPVVITDGADSATVAINVITNDQVVVSATVPPTFTMSLSGNSDSLGTLSASAVSTSTGVTATMSTNGNYGWFLWALDSQAGLRSTSQSKTIASVATGSNQTMNGVAIGTEKYALAVSAVSGTGALINANYAYNAGTTGGGLSTTTYNQIANGTAAVSGATATIKTLADISATTPAATDYSDTITLVGAGSF